MKLLLSLAAFVATASAQDCASYDGTGDGTVDVSDLLGLLGQFGCNTDGTGGGAAFTYVGCFRDNEGGRDLVGWSGNSGEQVPVAAANACAAICDGYNYFGLQWVHQCFCDNSYNNGYGNNGNQGNCPGGECPIADCDSDSTLDADGTADLCANGQGNCGNRNAVYCIGSC